VPAAQASVDERAATPYSSFDAVPGDGLETRTHPHIPVTSAWALVVSALQQRNAAREQVPSPFHIRHTPQEVYQATPSQRQERGLNAEGGVASASGRRSVCQELLGLPARDDRSEVERERTAACICSSDIPGGDHRFVFRRRTHRAGNGDLTRHGAVTAKRGSHSFCRRAGIFPRSVSASGAHSNQHADCARGSDEAQQEARMPRAAILLCRQPIPT
jgi:hypothetical protein